METAARVPRLSEAEYLAHERQAEIKSEFVNGEVFAMSGGTAAHSLLAGQVIRLLGNQLDTTSCFVFTSGMRVRLPDATHRYPDASALCGTPEFLDELRDSLLNPSLLVEILSDTSEAYDRGAKFRAYRQLPSFTDYLLISQDRMLVEHYQKRSGEWVLHEHSAPDHAVTLPSLHNTQIHLGDLYEQIELHAT